MNFLFQVLSNALKNATEQLKEGKISGVAKGSFYSFLSILATGYLANMDRRFGSIEESLRSMSQNVSSLQQVVPANLETTAWHTKELQRLARGMQRQWERIAALEGAARKSGIEVPPPPTIRASESN